MDMKEKVRDIVLCECGARISISQTSKGICPACGKHLNIPTIGEVRESEFTAHTSFDSQDSPPPSPHSSLSPQTHSTNVPMPDDGLDSAGRSSLTFASDVKIRSREAANLVSRGKIVEAIALYRWICEEHPEHRDAYYGLGFCYYKLGDFHRSKWMLEKAVELEHPNAGKLLVKVAQKLEQESLDISDKKDKETGIVRDNKLMERVDPGELLQDGKK